MKLAEWARANGVHPQTAYRWFREDRMPVPARRLESGTIWAGAAPADESGRVVVYARVSSHDQRHDLDRQVARLTDWATRNGHAVGEVVTEVGSGLNGKRPKLRRILSDPSASVVVVEHRDRLARFGVEHLQAALSAHGRKVVVTDPGETAGDLVRDMTGVLTSMCASLYGRHGAEPGHARGDRRQARGGRGRWLSSRSRKAGLRRHTGSRWIPARERAFRSCAGAARKAYNTMLALVKATMGQRQAERSYGIAEAGLTPALNWSLAGLRKQWNRRKDDVAPWWAENSKESCNTGLDALARGLDAWDKSRKGQQAGAAAGFPKFKSARSRRSVRFTTGTLRVDADRHHVTLPRLGRIRTHEFTRKLARRIEAGTARLLSATLTEESSGRWFCSFQVIVQRAAAAPAHAGAGAAAVGVDVGVKADSLLVIAAPDGREIERVPAPKSLTAAQARLRALQRKAARQQDPWDPVARTRRPPSKRWARTSRRIGRTHAHAAAVRRDVLHKATTSLAQHHQVITVETLNASGMRSAGGAFKRGLNRALADAALAEVRRMLGYKTRWYGSTLVEADRYYPSSKLCSGCGRRKPNLTLADRTYVCDRCGLRIDRDLNAAINLARLGEPCPGEQSPAGSGPVAGRGATRETEPARAGDAGGREASTPHQQPGKTGTASPQGEAA